MKKFFFLIILLTLIIGGFGAWWINGTAPTDSADKQERVFIVDQGEGVRQVANKLKTQGLIKDPVIFFLLVKQQGIEGKIQAGEFLLSPSMSASKVANVLQTATNDFRVTIPEGKRAEEVAAILQKHFLNYDPSWEEQLIANEGYLFPDTYSFAKDATIDTIIMTMKKNFEEKYASIPQGTRSLTKEELVIIASMVEREALFDEDRPLVASVIFNRIDAGTVLNIDATIQYALGYQASQKTWWKKHLSYDDLKINSRYNTYVNIGLPPAPIASPGLQVLTAVVNAPDTDYVYYVSDSEGHNHYTITLEQHDANIKKYGL